MINIVVGAVIGALINTGAYAALQLWRGRPIEWKPLVAAAVGGIVAGALAGTTMGASLLAGSTTSASEFLAVDGAISSGAEKVTSNALDSKALGDGVPEAAGWGAVTAPAAGMFLRGVGTEFRNLVTDAQAAAADSAAANATTAADTTTASATATADPAASSATTARAPIAAAGPTRTDRVTAQLPTPSAHVLGNGIANAAFGSPWVGEGVTVAQDAQNAAPVDPNKDAEVSAAIASLAPAPVPGAPDNAAGLGKLMAEAPAVAPARAGITDSLEKLTPTE